MVNHSLSRGQVFKGVSVLLIVLAAFVVECKQKFRVCVVDGRGSFKEAATLCPVLDQQNSKVECVIGLDRLDCLRRISKGTADFSVFSAEDLVTAVNTQVEVLLINELRYNKNDAYEYEIVAVFNNAAGIKSRYDLRDKRFCHPGYGAESEWTRILANYLEASIITPECDPTLTLVENRISASAKYFKGACKAGPWVHEPTLDQQLKSKYSNLCSLCGYPAICSKDDEYWGRRRSLFCLTDGAGDISWSRLDDVRSHFGLVPGPSFESPEDYSFLCPNGDVMPVNSTKPCTWVVKPWPVIAAKRSSAEEIQQFISTLEHSNETWEGALLELIETYHVNINTIRPIEAIESYLEKATGFLSANSFPSCHPSRTIRMCTTSNIENTKCSWLRESAIVYGIEPDIECLKANDTEHCMQAVKDNQVDVLMVEPDMVAKARRQYDLKTLFYETVKDDNKYITIAVVQNASNIHTFKDLRGKRACFPSHNGIAWNSATKTLHDMGLLKFCPYDDGMREFFGQSCVPGVSVKKYKSLGELCLQDAYNGEQGALKCLAEGNGDVAFVSQNSLKMYFRDGNEKYKILCEDKDKPCHLSWSPIGQAMIRSDTTEVWRRDALDVFLQMDHIFGKNHKSVTIPISLYALFNEHPDILFHDATIKLRSMPIAKNTDKMIGQYESILDDFKVCSVPSLGAKVYPLVMMTSINLIFVVKRFIGI